MRHIEDVVARMARIPAKSVSQSDKEVLRNLERNLKLVIYGQDRAIDSLAAAIKMARSGLGDQRKPVGSFLFAGPTGVGKTEVTRQLAIAMGIEFIRFDMSEYMERHTVSRLIGAPPGYVGFDQGGLLTEAIAKHPHCVLLLDEVEKAHPDVFNLLLQVMDHGTLTDNNGRKADFRHVVIVMTTNAGAFEMNRASIGFVQSDNASDGAEAIKRLFSPEFRNRIDAIIQFAPLDMPVIERVVDKLLLEIEAQLEKKGVSILLDDDARRWLAEKGYDPKMGARPMARLMQEQIKRPLAEELLFGKLVGGRHGEDRCQRRWQEPEARRLCRPRRPRCPRRSSKWGHSSFANKRDGPEGLRWRRRAVRSPGKRGRLRFGAIRLPTADSLCSLKVARASKISGRKFSAAARRKRTAFRFAEMAAPKCNAAAVGRFLLAALHSVAKRVRRGQAYHPTRFVPVCPETAPHASAATIRSFVPDPSHRGLSPRVEKIARLGVLVLAEAWSRALFSQQRQMGTSLRSLARGDRAVSVGAPSEG